MKQNAFQRSQGGQMLLATGVVLLMSLLSMAIFGVKVAGLTLPHDAASDDVIVTTGEVLDVLEPLTQARTTMWMNGGLDGLEAAELALDTVHDDLLHHGELRGVEIKLTQLVLTQVDASSVAVSGELGVSDGEAMLTYNVAFTLNV
jgi:hypothetical protein